MGVELETTVGSRTTKKMQRSGHAAGSEFTWYQASFWWAATQKQLCLDCELWQILNNRNVHGHILFVRWLLFVIVRIYHHKHLP